MALRYRLEVLYVVWPIGEPNELGMVYDVLKFCLR